MKRHDIPPRILVAPLNWGLGHVTRCIPLIRSLESQATVFLASDGEALHLLRAEFPHLQAFELPSYRIRYAPGNMTRNIARQLPRILYAIGAEYRATQQLADRLELDGIISDNRYGCRSKQVSSVLLTHQLFLRIPNSLLKMTANGILHRAMAGFDAIWVPDEAKMPNLSGALSHGPPIHPATHYTGILTRMQAQQIPKEYDVAVVLSGPEPQRSLLEQEILRQALDIPLKFLFVLGKTQTREQFKPAKHIQVVSYLTSTELNQALNASDYVICRSGYSSLMDLAALGKKAILIPTPGQTEQEYLASRLAESGKFIVQNQHQIDLLKGLSEINKTTGFEPNAFNTNIYHHTITTWISNLNAPPHH